MYGTRWFEASETPQKALIFLHGRGQASRSAQAMAQRLFMPDSILALPEAPSQSWYPASFLSAVAMNEAELEASLRYLEEVIEQVVDRGISPDAITLAGFSQGAALAAEFAGRKLCAFGALIAFTGGRIGPWNVRWSENTRLDNMRMLFSGSARDPFVPFKRIEETIEHFMQRGATVDFLSFDDTDHCVREEEYRAALTIIA
ncbi:dienelactone hydrolase family protein [Paraburkholderia sediminicola]|uniref:alpha/beta hydrolase n=1 Tax=Paraburkholderia sediminicola TaxID=458836 RepID=UPI0038B74AD7